MVQRHTNRCDISIFQTLQWNRKWYYIHKWYRLSWHQTIWILQRSRFWKNNPFIEKYFTPSKLVQNKINAIAQKYEIDYDNTCALFHRGLDKVTETEICSYEDKIEKAKELLKENPNIRFLIQSDETGFIEKACETFPDNSFYCKDEIFHMEHDAKTLVDHKYRKIPRIGLRIY